MTPASQDKAAGSVMGMAGQLSGASSDVEGPGSDVIEGVAGSMAAGLGNMLGAAGGTALSKVRRISFFLSETIFFFENPINISLNISQLC